MQQRSNQGPIARFIIEHSGGVITAQNINLFLVGIAALFLVVASIVLFGGGGDMPNYEPEPPSAPSEANIPVQ